MSHAIVPVVVVQKVSLSLTREVVVGVDGSKGCLAAVEFAFQEASLRKSRLRAVHAWTRPAPDRPDMIPLLYDLDETQAAESRLLSESLAGWGERYPDVEIVQKTVHDKPVHALAAASGRADLLVLGTGGLGGFSGLLLGSVSHALLRRAQCPTAIVPSVILRS